MQKKFLILSMLFLLFVTLNYTYSSFSSTIVGNISGNVKDWIFKVNVNGGTEENDYFKVPISSSTGSFIVNLNTTNSTKDSDYNIEFVSNNLPSDIKFCTDSACNNVIENNLYTGEIEKNSIENLTIYYKSSSTANGNVFVKTKAKIIEYAFMKNGANDKTEFWSDTYRANIKSIEFKKSLTGLPSSCTNSNKCWDISESSTQSKKVYAYLTTNSSDSSKYDLHILSKYRVYAPNFSGSLFYSYTSLTAIAFNNNFYTSRVTNMQRIFSGCSSLTSLDLSSFNTSNVTDVSYMFYGCSSLTNLDLSSFKTSMVTNMRNMFQNCSSLTSLSLSNFNTSKVTNMHGMFFNCSSLTNLDLSNFNTSNVTIMDYMFGSCSSLTNLDISNFNTSKVKDMQSMFSYCSSLTSLDLSNFIVSNVTTMRDMFYGCSSLTSLDLSNFNTLKVIDMGWMFCQCSSLLSLDLSNFNTSNVENMEYMFSNCSSLKKIDLSNFNTSNVTSMSAMFTKCSSLISLDLSNFNTSNVKNMQHMFSWCSKLTTLNLSGFDTSKVENIGSMFHRCSLLTTLGDVVFDTTNVTSISWMFGYCNKLTATINITNAKLISENYGAIFYNAATESGAKIIVNYISEASSIVQDMKNKTSNVGSGNVVLSSVIPQNNTITISGNSNINYEIPNRLSGTNGRLISTDGTKYVTSFKLNGETIEGNKFVMPNTNATITDITTVDCATIQTAHNPYAASQSNVVVGTKTFSGVKSLTVLLQYQTTDSSDYFQIFDSSTATTSINNGKKYYTDNRVTIEEKITINSNYVKFTFTSDANISGYYGFRAIIIPNY